MLRRLHDRRPLGSVGKAHDPLDPEQIAAALAGQPAERPGKIEPADLAAEHQSESVDAMGMGGAAARALMPNSTAPASAASTARMRSARSLIRSSRRTSSAPTGARSVLVITS